MEQAKQRDKQLKKWNEGNDDLRARSHPAKFPTFKKGTLKKLVAFCGGT